MIPLSAHLKIMVIYFLAVDRFQPYILFTYKTLSFRVALFLQIDLRKVVVGPLLVPDSM